MNFNNHRNFKLFLLTLWSVTVIFTAVAQEPEAQAGESSADFKQDMQVVFGERTASQTAADKSLAEWYGELFKHMVESGDDFSQALVLAKQMNGFKNSKLLASMHNNQTAEDALNDSSFQPLADALNLLITKPDLSPAAMDVLTAVCMNKEVKDHCHANVLLQKRMQSESRNLRAYLRPFDFAVQSNNQAAQEKLIKIMAMTEYSHSPVNLTPLTMALIDDFMASNPFPQVAIDSMVEDYQKLSGISAGIKDQLEQLMPSYLPTYVKWNFLLMNDVPPFRPLLAHCKVNHKDMERCSDIGLMMTEASNSMIDKGIGHAILIATAELSRDSQLIALAQQRHDAFKTEYECIVDLVHGSHPMDNHFNPTYRQTSLENLTEYQKLIKHAEQRYTQLKTEGDQSAVDPKSCFNSNTPTDS